jgi:hypothetical protein
LPTNEIERPLWIRSGHIQRNKVFLLLRRYGRRRCLVGVATVGEKHLLHPLSDACLSIIDYRNARSTVRYNWLFVA